MQEVPGPASTHGEEAESAREAPDAAAREVPEETSDAHVPDRPSPRGEEAEIVRARPGLASTPHVSAVPLPQMLLRLEQVAVETKVVALKELEALEAERQRLSDWQRRLEDCTRSEAAHFAREWEQVRGRWRSS